MPKRISVNAGLSRRNLRNRRVATAELIQRFQIGRPASLRALCVRMGPFEPAVDGFRFVNSFPMTDEQASEIRRRYRVVTDVAIGAAVQQVRAVLDSVNVTAPIVGTVGLPGLVIDAVIGEVTAKLAGPLIDSIVTGPIPGKFGRCGGMAYSGYDFFLQSWPVDERLGTSPPAAGELGNYIFRRLLDSLDANADVFVDWFINLHIMPTVSVVANAALGAAVGTIGGPAGAAFGALFGAKVGLFHLGGPKVILERTKQEWDRIKQALDSQAAVPIGVLFEDSSSPIADHQVLAVDFEDGGKGTPVLTVWDNNDGNVRRALQLDFRGDELVVGNIKGKVKGIFLERYSPVEPPLSLKLP